MPCSARPKQKDFRESWRVPEPALGVKSLHNDTDLPVNPCTIGVVQPGRPIPSSFGAYCSGCRRSTGSWDVDRSSDIPLLRSPRSVTINEPGSRERKGRILNALMLHAPEDKKALIRDAGGGSLVKLGQERLKGSATDFFAKFGEKETQEDRLAAAHYLLGLGCLGTGDVAGAKAELAMAMELHRNNLWARRKLSEVE